MPAPKTPSSDILRILAGQLATLRHVVAITFFSMLGCAAEPAADTPPLAAIALPADFAAILRAYERAYAGRDSAAFAALFAADGFLLRPGTPLLKGGAAIAANLADEGGSLTLVPVASAGRRRRLADCCGHG